MKLSLLATMLMASLPAFAAVSVTAAGQMPYGGVVESGALRYLTWQVKGGTTNLLNITGTGVTILGCTTNCPGVAGVIVTAAGGTGSTTGTTGSFVLHSTSDATVTATSTEDPTKSYTYTLHVIDTSVDAFVAVTPVYNQAYQGQSKTLQSHVIGYPASQQDVTWAITGLPGGGNATLTDTGNRDTVFNSGTVSGRYTITATSVANGSISGSAIIYVGTSSLPRVVSPNKTETTACFVDPAMTGTDYEIGPSHAVTDPSTINLQSTSSNAGITLRFFNEDVTGTNPTTYHNSFILANNGTPTQPLWICGVPDSAGNLPIIDGVNAKENGAGSGKFVDGQGGFKLLFNNGCFGCGYNRTPSTGPDYVNVVGLKIQNFTDPYYYYPPESIVSIVRTSGTVLVTYNGPLGCYMAHAIITGVTNDPTLNGSYTFGQTGNPAVCSYSSAGADITATGTLVSQFEYGAGSGVYLRSGRYDHFEGLDIQNTNWGIIENNNTVFAGTTFTEFMQVMGSHISNFAPHQPFGMQAIYIQGLNGLIEGNVIENPMPGDESDVIKARGGGTIIRYNTMVGDFTGGSMVDYVDEIDSWQYVDIASAIGQPGVTSCPTTACWGVTANNITISQLTENMEAMAQAYEYGNVESNQAGRSGYVYDQFSAMSGPQECLADQGVWCTNGVDWQGTLYSFNNTYDQASAYDASNSIQGGVYATVNFHSSGFIGDEYNLQPAVFSANNSMWNDTATNGGCSPTNCFPWNISVDTTFVGQIQTNMMATGALDCSGTVTGGTTAGWGGYISNFAYTNSNPMTTHVTGVSGPNCLTTSSFPYNAVSFVPTSGSALINAGSAITRTEVHHMPVRFEPVYTGYMKARTDVGSSTPTIGAKQFVSGTQPTLVSATIVPTNHTYPFSAIGTNEFYSLPAVYSDGTIIEANLRSEPWNATQPTTGDGIFCFHANNPFCDIHGVGSGVISTSYTSSNPTTPYTVRGSSTITVQSGTGKYRGTAVIR